MTPRILKPKQAAEYLGIPANTLAFWRYLDKGDGGQRGPRYIAANGICTGYPVDALDEWMSR